MACLPLICPTNVADMPAIFMIRTEDAERSAGSATAPVCAEPAVDPTPEPTCGDVLKWVWRRDERVGKGKPACSVSAPEDYGDCASKAPSERLLVRVAWSERAKRRHRAFQIAKVLAIRLLEDGADLAADGDE